MSETTTTPTVTRATTPYALDELLRAVAAEKGLMFTAGEDLWGSGTLRRPWRWWQRRPGWRIKVQPNAAGYAAVRLGDVQVWASKREHLSLAEALAARIVAELGVPVEVLY